MIEQLFSSFLAFIKRLVRLWDSQVKKYQKRDIILSHFFRLWKYICISFVGILLYNSSSFASILYSSYYLQSNLNLHLEKFLMTFIILSLHLFIMIAYNCVMYYIYRSKIQFFESYRIKTMAMQVDFQKWKITFKKTIKCISINLFIIGPILTFTDSNLKLDIYGLGFKIVALWICPVHLVTICVWLIFRIVEASDKHCGYQWSWAQPSFLPFSATSRYHSFHHSHNVGNFGSFFCFWDVIFDTNKEYIKYEDQLQKTKKG